MRDRISEQANDVFFVQGPASNWVILREGSEFTLVDSGYPSDLNLVIDSIKGLGLEPGNAAAMLITHGHTDHTGGAAHFSRTFGTPILSSAAEHRTLLGEEKYQVDFATAMPYLWRPTVFRWALHAIFAGGMKTNDIPAAAVWSEEQLRQLPGTPTAIPTPGHTPGHTAFLLPSGAVITGDALVTGHPISPVDGPQMLHPMYHHDLEGARKAIDALAIPSTVILPGHGPALEGDLSVIAPTVR